MKWEKIQADLIKKLIAVDKDMSFTVKGDGYIEVNQKYIIFRIPMLFMCVHMPDDIRETKSFIDDWTSANMRSIKKLCPVRVELVMNKPVQIFNIPESGEEIKVNTTLYSKYTEKADELSFWGKNRHSPVVACYGGQYVPENVVFMVLPINY